MTARVAINGLGRIGRATVKIVLDEPDLDLVAMNGIALPDGARGEADGRLRVALSRRSPRLQAVT